MGLVAPRHASRSPARASDASAGGAANPSSSSSACRRTGSIVPAVTPRAHRTSTKVCTAGRSERICGRESQTARNVSRVGFSSSPHRRAWASRGLDTYDLFSIESLAARRRVGGGAGAPHSLAHEWMIDQKVPSSLLRLSGEIHFLLVGVTSCLCYKMNSGARDAAQTGHKRQATKTGRHVVTQGTSCLSLAFVLKKEILQKEKSLCRA